MKTTSIIGSPFRSLRASRSSTISNNNQECFILVTNPAFLLDLFVALTKTTPRQPIYSTCFVRCASFFIIFFKKYLLFYYFKITYLVDGNSRNRLTRPNYDPYPLYFLITTTLLISYHEPPDGQCRRGR